MSHLLLGGAQAISVLVLLLTGYLHPVAIAFLGLIFLAGLFTTKVLECAVSDRWFLWTYFLLFPFAYFLHRYFQWHPIILAAQFGLLGHAISFFQTTNERVNAFRQAFSFVHILLAAAMTPELHIGFGIFTVIVLNISATFLKNMAGTRELRPVEKFPPILLPGILILSFLGAWILFPLLPRPKHSGYGRKGFGIGQHVMGYSGNVQLDGIQKMDASNERISYRIFSKKSGPKFSEVFPGGFLKISTLDYFDGRSWTALRFRGTAVDVGEDEKWNLAPIRLEFVKEPASNDGIAIPYQHAMIRTDMGSGDAPIRYDSGRGDFEWVGSKERRVKYEVAFDPEAGPTRFTSKPNVLHRSLLPEFQKDPFFLSILGQIFPRGFEKLSYDERARAILSYFTKNGFIYSLGGFPRTLRGIDLLHAFFKSRAGHCELFASATTLLLKLAEVPSRIATGYLLSNDDPQMWVARESNSHAWVEYWDGAAWKPVDPTPPRIIVAGNAWGDRFARAWQNLSLRVSGWWYLTIVDFDPSQQKHSGWGWSRKFKFFDRFDGYSRALRKNPKAKKQIVRQFQVKIFTVVLVFGILALFLTKVFMWRAHYRALSHLTLKWQLLFYRERVAYLLRRYNCSSLEELKKHPALSQEQVSFISHYETLRFSRSPDHEQRKIFARLKDAWKSR